MKKVIMDVGEKYQDITGPTAEAFIDELIKLEQSPYEEIILDFKDTTSISSMAMGTLYSTYQTLSNQNRSIKVVNPSVNVSRLLRLVNMSDIMDDSLPK